MQPITKVTARRRKKTEGAFFIRLLSDRIPPQEVKCWKTENMIVMPDQREEPNPVNQTPKIQFTFL